MLQGVVEFMSRPGMEIELVQPECCELMPESAEIAKKQAGEAGGSFSFVDRLEEAL